MISARADEIVLTNKDACTLGRIQVHDGSAMKSNGIQQGKGPGVESERVRSNGMANSLGFEEGLRTRTLSKENLKPPGDGPLDSRGALKFLGWAQPGFKTPTYKPNSL